MPSENRAALRRYRLQKARECLDAAGTLLAAGLYPDSANRSYYAMFHAIRALLALDGVDFKKHSGVISYFQQTYIKTGILDTRFSDYIRAAFSIRQKSDYSDFYLLSKQEVEEQLARAKELVEAVSVLPDH